MEQYTMDDCVFCKDFPKDRIIYEDTIWVAVLDGYPVTEGHTLLIPKRHCETYFDLNETEYDSLSQTIRIVSQLLRVKYNPQGFNIGVNCGSVAGQTVHHCHIHIIPRYEGDCENPRGGIRGCVPHKMVY